MRKVNQLRAGALLSYVSLAINNIISILYTPFMIRLLGQSEYGLYNLANSVIGYLGILDFGLGNAIIRYGAKYRAVEDKDGESNLYGLFSIVYIFIACIVILAGIILSFNVYNIFSNSLSTLELKKMRILIVLMAGNLAISLPGGIFAAIITVYERFIFPKILGIVRSIINPFIMLPLLLIGYKSIAMAVVTTIINILWIFINMYYCFRILNIKFTVKKIDFSIFGEVTKYSFYIFLNMIVDKVYWSTDQFILGAIKGTSVVAVYSIGSTINQYYMNFSNAISGVFLPKVTKMVTKNASDKSISDLFIKVGRVQYLVMSFILGGFILVGSEFIKLWAGEGYSESFLIALIVMIPLTIPLIQNLGITILQAKNDQKFRSILYIIIAIANITFSIPLATWIGGIGAALATSVAMVVGNIIIINIYYYKKIKIDIPLFWKNIIKMSIPFFIAVASVFILNKIFIISGLLYIIINAGLYSLIFITLMWRFAMNEYEKLLVKSILEKVKGQ